MVKEGAREAVARAVVVTSAVEMVGMARVTVLARAKGEEYTWRRWARG